MTLLPLLRLLSEDSVSQSASPVFFVRDKERHLDKRNDMQRFKLYPFPPQLRNALLTRMGISQCIDRPGSCRKDESVRLLVKPFVHCPSASRECYPSQSCTY